jgi:hypothetical protein
MVCVKTSNIGNKAFNVYLVHDDEEIRTILVYIGLITVILFLVLIIYSLINKYRKMLYKEISPLHDERTFVMRIGL